ncbi:MAG: hypothetical protein M1812_000445 [Candelaria pacifica]|nr:MAG: hypothetical protein M1812_000445 [Candelaria pacifica]
MPSTLPGVLQGSPSSSLLERILPQPQSPKLDSERVERPQKRRKLTKEHTIEDQACGGPDEDVLTLFRADLDLVYADENLDWSNLSSTGAHQDNKPLPVVVRLREGDGVSQLLVTAIDGTLLVDSPISFRTTNPELEGLRRIVQIDVATKRRRQPNHLATASIRYLLLLPSSGSGQFLLQAKALWRVAKSITSYNRLDLLAEALLAAAFPKDKADTSTTWSPQDFYEAVHVPDKHQNVNQAIQTEKVECQLYPFQKRAVNWLLGREGVELGSDGVHQLGQHRQDSRPLPFFQQAADVDDRECFVSHLLGVIVTDPSLARQPSDIRGGILAEEMGLGKTVELIALIALHKRNELSADLVHDNYSGRPLRQSPGTLIIAPPSILKQWKTEIWSHAPSLKVLHYEGMNTGYGKKLKEEELIAKFLDQDVVLTTYNVLANEIHYAGPTPDRHLRHEKRFEPRRSPLVQLQWWRVCLDEAQMVESGVSNAATVARMIPRCNAWAVSGTPLRKSVTDLLGLLIFLRYDPICQSSQLWNRLLAGFKNSFKAIFGQIALRHTKDQVRDELQLPPQRRIVISTTLSQIEEQNYAHNFSQMADECGLSTEGAPLSEDWDPDSSAVIANMRNWLTRLRQTCLHPEVGGRNRRALGHSDKPLRTVEEVLEVMIEQNESSILATEKIYLTSKIQRGQILERASKSESALELWLQALTESRAIVLERRTALTASSDQVHSSGDDEAAKAELNSDSDRGATADKGQKPGRAGAYRQRLRVALELEHVCTFFVANAYYQLKSKEEATLPPQSKRFQELEKAEEEAYEKAKLLRKELLAEVLKKVGRRMGKVGKKAQDQTYAEIPEILLTYAEGGIESRKIFERLQQLGDNLNDQANQIDEWREKMIQLLLEPLVDDEEGIELQGDEYESSTKQQDKVYVYMEALRATVADRQDALTGESNLLIKNEVSFALERARKGEGHDPELLMSLLAQRAESKPNQSLRGLQSEFRALATELRARKDGGSTRASAELSLVDKGLREIQQITTEQAKPVSLIEKELELFRGTMNHRIDYYRQLQQLSDTVAPFEEHGGSSDNALLVRFEQKEGKLATRIASLKAKGRYLVHLRTESTNSESQRICVICQQTFEMGSLTVCGHQYCKECFQMWWSHHRSCPVCKKHLTPSDFHQITYKPQELSLQEEGKSTGLQESSTKEQLSIYSSISSSILNQIKRVDLDGSFGTKIDTIAKHLLWIRENDPGAKSIVFSQYRDFLDVLGRAFDQFKIGFTTIDRKGGIEKFKNDPSVECFLLHAKGQASGLNLVNATHVFLCEPLVNTAIELQAIARIHRIGQHLPTTVWAYLVNDTVEESIYDISVSRRLAHIGRVTSGPTKQVATNPDLLESSIDAANSLEMQQVPLSNLLTKGPSGGEIVEKSDLWDCLFKKAKKRGFEGTHGWNGEVDRHLRATAAEERVGVGSSSSSGL